MEQEQIPEQMGNPGKSPRRASEGAERSGLAKRAKVSGSGDCLQLSIGSSVGIPDLSLLDTLDSDMFLGRTATEERPGLMNCPDRIIPATLQSEAAGGQDTQEPSALVKQHCLKVDRSGMVEDQTTENVHMSNKDTSQYASFVSIMNDQTLDEELALHLSQESLKKLSLSCETPKGP